LPYTLNSPHCLANGFYILQIHQKTKESGNAKPCIHQRNVSQISEAKLAPFAGQGRESHELNELNGLPPKEAESNHQHTPDTTSVCDICKENKKIMTRYRRRLMLGLFFPFLVQSFDITIIAGALPFIASDFREPLKSWGCATTHV
jgi:hypothetical protein